MRTTLPLSTLHRRPSWLPPRPPPPSASSLHSTDWSSVSLPRFCFWMSLFSIAENFLFYPFYLLKTREQADRSAHYRALESARFHLNTVMRKEGARGLYRGFAASSFVSLPAYGLYSGVYTWAKEQLGYHTASPSADDASSSFAGRHPQFVAFAAPFVAGLVADVASIGLYVPGDVIVQRLQLLNSPTRPSRMRAGAYGRTRAPRASSAASTPLCSPQPSLRRCGGWCTSRARRGCTAGKRRVRRPHHRSGRRRAAGPTPAVAVAGRGCGQR